jgi:hypothetical protein
VGRLSVAGGKSKEQRGKKQCAREILGVHRVRKIKIPTESRRLPGRDQPPGRPSRNLCSIWEGPCRKEGNEPRKNRHHPRGKAVVWHVHCGWLQPIGNAFCLCPGPRGRKKKRHFLAILLLTAYALRGAFRVFREHAHQQPRGEQPAFRQQNERLRDADSVSLAFSTDTRAAI